MYRIEFTEDAKNQLKLLQRNTPKSVKKLKKILVELAEHPREGTGKVERLKHYATAEVYSRRLDKRNRIVYEIFEDVLIVQVLSTYGHYTEQLHKTLIYK